MMTIDHKQPPRANNSSEVPGLIDRLVSFARQVLPEGPGLAPGNLNQLADTVPSFGDAVRTAIASNVEALDASWGLQSGRYRASVAMAADRAATQSAHGDLDTAVTDLASAHDAAAAAGDLLTRRLTKEDVLKEMRCQLSRRPTFSADEQHAQLRNFLNGVLADVGGAAIPASIKTDTGTRTVAVAAGADQYVVSADFGAEIVTYGVDFVARGGEDMVTAARVQRVADEAISRNLPTASRRIVATLSSSQELSDGRILLRVWASGGTAWCAAALAEQGYRVGAAGREQDNDLVVLPSPRAVSERPGFESSRMHLGTFTRRSDVAAAIRHHHDPAGSAAAEAVAVAGQGFPETSRATPRSAGGAGQPPVARRLIATEERSA